jgi:hypothetical protein
MMPPGTTPEAFSGVVKPTAADLFCGLGGWTEGLIAEGWHARGYDIEEHVYGDERYPGEFVQRDILQMHGREVADVDLIVSSSPCTEYSYMAMPWTRAKAKAAAIRADLTGQALRDLNALFDAQFRIQREACEAAGRYIPMVCENVRGAQPWVGRAAANFGSYYLWGDVPALMPAAVGARKVPGFRFDGSGGSFQTASVEHHELAGRKNTGGSWFKIGSPGQTAVNNNPDGRQWTRDPVASASSGSAKRKAASAKIAKIPFALSSWIARCYLPERVAA